MKSLAELKLAKEREITKKLMGIICNVCRMEQIKGKEVCKVCFTASKFRVQ